MFCLVVLGKAFDKEMSLGLTSRSGRSFSLEILGIEARNTDMRISWIGFSNVLKERLHDLGLHFEGGKRFPDSDSPHLRALNPASPADHGQQSSRVRPCASPVIDAKRKPGIAIRMLFR